VTSQNLWPRYDRHFVGIVWHNVLMCGVNGRRFVMLFTRNSIRWFMKMSVWSLTSQRSVFSDITVANISESFTHKMAAKTSWHRYESKWRHWHPMYVRDCMCARVVHVSNPHDEFSAPAEAEKVATDVTLDADLTVEPDGLDPQSRCRQTPPDFRQLQLDRSRISFSIQLCTDSAVIR